MAAWPISCTTRRVYKTPVYCTKGLYFNFLLEVSLDSDYLPGSDCPVKHDGTEGLYIKVFRESSRLFRAYCHYSKPTKVDSVKYLVWQGTGSAKPILAQHGSFADVLNRQLISLDCWELGCDYKPRNINSIKRVRWHPY